MDALASAISEAARATTIEEIGERAFPALARALGACPVFLTRAAPTLARSMPIAGEYRPLLPEYLEHWVPEDPLWHIANSAAHPVTVLEEHVDRRTIQASLAYNEFHRSHDFEHHMLVRFFGDAIVPGALLMGFTRGRRLREFGRREAEVASLALPAFRGAAERISQSAAVGGAARAPALAARFRLTRAEAEVLST